MAIEPGLVIISKISFTFILNYTTALFKLLSLKQMINNKCVALNTFVSFEKQKEQVCSSNVSSGKNVFVYEYV